jgi:putative FmdB family regulatory protein
MPLYEYECTACHRRTEKIQKFSDPELTDCPHCGGRLERTVTAPAFNFAGGGWYKDLYSSTKPTGASVSSDSSAASTTSSTANSSTSSEGSKPAAAPTTSSTT